MRAVRIEALEDARERILANAGAVIIDDDFNVRAPVPAGDPDLAAGFGERLRVRQQVGDNLPDPRIVARDIERIDRTFSLETQIDGDIVATFRFVGGRGERCEKAAKI